MSLSNSNNSISSSLPISELIKQIKHSFLERDFKKVQNILMERENGLKIEIENLTRDRDSAKEEVRVLERKGDSVDLERLNFEENLRKSQRKCDDLEEKVARLLEEMKVSKDREKRAEERHDKIFTEHTKMTIEKIRSISELQETINELKTKNLENDRLLRDYKEKCKCLDIKVAQKDQEIEGLTREKLDAVKTIDELRAEVSESNKIIDELKLKISESDKVAELYKSIDEGLSDILNVKSGHRVDIADLALLYEKASKPATSKGRANSEFPGSKGKNDSSGNAAEVVTVNAMSPGVCKSTRDTGSKNSGLSKKGDRNSVQRRTRKDDDDARSVNTPRVSQPFRDPQAESNKRKNPLDSGARRASGTRLMSIARCSTKSTHSPPPGDIIEIIESDDETSTNENSHIPNGVLGSNPSKNKTNIVQSPLSEQRRKRNKTDTGEGFIMNSTTKNKTPESTTTRGRIDCSSSRKCAKDDAVPVFGAQTPVKKLKNGLKDMDSESSDDESLSDSRIGHLVESLCNERMKRKIVYEADLLLAIQQDADLCLNAVCALYRQEVIAKKQNGLSNSSKNRGFSPIDSMSGCALAEYLIDGDKDLRLRKSVSEVKKQRPDVIGQCRKLANIYVEKLLEIYCSGVDPLFSQS
ncbi:hypothetical protein CASFOL_036771 [Castilleja foliolosa]|uniref:FRIGIDA-like protein n=1 Tax=Castilleja foliolosa TaxID=1961234 RepID=A0ABD3BPZ9_9LAMI